MERDSVVDGAEDLPHGLPGLRPLGRCDDAGGRGAGRAREAFDAHAEELGEERRANGRKAFRPLARRRGVVLPVVGHESDDGALPRDGCEEPLAQAAEVVEAVDEERLGGRRADRRGGPLERGRRVGEAGAPGFEVGDQRRHVSEEESAVRRRRDGGKEVAEPPRVEARLAEVVRRPEEERGEGGLLAQLAERGAGGVLAKGPPREELLSERRKRRARVGSRAAVARQVEERDEAQVRDPAERLGGATPQVDAEKVRADEDVNGAERVGRLEGANFVEEPGFERGEVAGEESVFANRRHPAECTAGVVGTLRRPAQPSFQRGARAASIPRRSRIRWVTKPRRSSIVFGFV